MLCTTCVCIFCFQILIHTYMKLYLLFCKHLLLYIKTYIKNINFKKLWWETAKNPINIDQYWHNWIKYLIHKWCVDKWLNVIEKSLHCCKFQNNQTRNIRKFLALSFFYLLWSCNFLPMNNITIYTQTK